MPSAVERTPFGVTRDGRAVERYVLRDGGLQAAVLTYGATLQVLEVPGGDGRPVDVVLGYDDVAGYEDGPGYLGAVVGRYANRIARGRFELDGRTYSLPVNNGPNCLHGGTYGFDRVVWNARPLPEAGAALELSLVSPDGDMGFPGTLRVSVTYALAGAELTISYRATTDAPTVVNLTNHAYFNLAGAGSGTVEGHELQLDASRYVPVDATGIPLGGLADVDGTPMDFRRPTAVGARLRSPTEQLLNVQGYDHCWVFDGGSDLTRPRAVLRDPGSGRRLEVRTDQPGVQLYTGNYLDGSTVGKAGRTHRQSDGLCLETQHLPDAPNQPGFASTVLRPGEEYATTTVLGLG